MDALISALLNPSPYDHDTQNVSLLETHISWVLLTGPFAYKIKKPVAFSFLDFSTLEKRRNYCEEEVRLNQRFSSGLYEGVVSITKHKGCFHINGPGDVVEYAVKMRQFSQDALLSNLANAHQLEETHIDDMALAIAAFHETTQKSDTENDYGDPEEIIRHVMDNFANIRPQLSNDTDRDLLESIRLWSQWQGQNLTKTFQARKRDGFIRECHGDLHLGNMALIDHQVTPFDCIEFNEYLRWIDVMSEAAFVFMDLRDRDYPGLAYRFLNQYLERTGDYRGVGLLRFYSVYRSTVRAKVAMLHLKQEGISKKQHKQLWDEYQGYLQLSRKMIDEARPLLIITHGVTGSGKSTCTSQLLQELGAIRIRSDVERKRLFGYQANSNTQSKFGAGIYTKDAGQKTYARLEAFAEAMIAAGYTVIVDAVFLKRDERKQFSNLAKRQNIPFIILNFQAPQELLEKRVQRREKSGKDPSEADLEVLDAQLKTRQALDHNETGNVIPVDAAKHVDVEQIVKKVQKQYWRNDGCFSDKNPGCD